LHPTSPMVRVWKPKPIGKATLTAPWNLQARHAPRIRRGLSVKHGASGIWDRRVIPDHVGTGDDD
jgi:hypothetical protein